MSIERFSLDGKVAIVTGGAGGCGEEYGRGLTAAGARVVLADLDGEKAERVAGELRDQGREAIGVRGTPAILTENGQYISGYMPPQELLAEIKNLQVAKR